jgi:toxin ParE1/3/4
VTRPTLRFSKRAVQDIKNVLAYTLTQFGEQKHHEYKELIRRALSDIVIDSSRHPARGRPELHRDARTFHIARSGQPARHFFLYRVVGNEFIDIARLLHDAMYLQRHLPDRFDRNEA